MSFPRLTPEQFGIAMAKAIKERPWSSNWALAHLAVEISGIGDADEAYAEMPAFIDSIIAQEKK